MDDWNAWEASGAGNSASTSSNMAYGSSMGQGYSNNVGSSTSASTGWSSGTGSSNTGYSGGPRPAGLHVRAQLNIEKMPHETSVDKIRNIFGRYGDITRIVCDYNLKDKRLHVWLDYEGEQAAETALRENGREMQRNNKITVQKCSNSSGDSYTPKRPRTDRSNNDSSFNDSGSGGANESSASWGNSWDDSGNDNSSSNNGDRRRSGRGGFERRGGRGDRGGRGRGRGRYEPYGSSRSESSKSESWAAPDWDSVVNSDKSGTSSSQSQSTSNSEDWAGGW